MLGGGLDLKVFHPQIFHDSKTRWKVRDHGVMKGGIDTGNKFSLLEKLCICSEGTPKESWVFVCAAEGPRRISGEPGGCGDISVSMGAALRKEL